MGRWVMMGRWRGGTVLCCSSVCSSSPPLDQLSQRIFTPTLFFWGGGGCERRIINEFGAVAMGTCC